jgi:hypothetical protein
MIFHDSFVNKTKNILNLKCSGSKTLFKRELVKELGFNILDKKELNLGLNIVSSMFSLNYFPEWEVITGKFGGIKHKSNLKKKNVKIFPNNFLEILFQVLNTHCNSVPISKNKIVQLLNLSLPNQEVSNLISVAIQKKYIIGFLGKRGKKGGIVKDPLITPRIMIEGLAIDGTEDLPLPARQDKKEALYWSSADDLEHLNYQAVPNQL